MKYKFSEYNAMEIDFGDMENTFFLVGLLNQFMNRFQTAGDRFFCEISWKQCFLLICTGYFKNPPSISELSDLMGSSHQNIKQMLLKLERAGFVSLEPDEEDKRKQRIVLSEKTKEFTRRYDKASTEFMEQLFHGVDKEDLEITIKTILKLDEQLRKMK